jgi:hypothetical protein
MRTLISITLLLACVAVVPAQGPDKSIRTPADKLEKRAGSPRWQVLTINKLWTWHRSDGEGNHSPSGQPGLNFPKFTSSPVYEDNIVFGAEAYVGNFPENGGVAVSSQPVRINGGTYLTNHGMDAGWVEGAGAAADPVDPNNLDVRIYRIRRDYDNLSEEELSEEAAIYHERYEIYATEVEKQQIRSQYDEDWVGWPVDRGAPYIERNGVPGYQAPPPFSPLFTVDNLVRGNYDEPGVAGANKDRPADQVIFTVYNDLRAARTLNFEASHPLGIEVQKTVWGYKNNTSLGYHYFTRYKILNKGGVDIGNRQMGAFYLDNIYLCQWSDPDVGSAGDDLVGCDSLLSLGFAYNGYPTDNGYARYSLPPPSVGYLFLAGPLVDGAPTDSGIADFERVYGKRNLPMSSFAYFSAGSDYTDPPFVDYEYGAGRWWKLLRGFAPVGSMWSIDEPYYHPPGFPITKFPLSGDPVAGTGFIDGLGETYSFAPGDRRLLLNTGPFRLAPNDTAEIIVGVVVGMGGDRLSSVAVMKAYSRFAHEALQSIFDIPGAPHKPKPTVVGLDQEIILSWGEDRGAVEETEQKTMIGGYRFEGYNIYQLPSQGSNVSDGIKLATFDLKNGVTTIRNTVYKPEYAQTVSEIVQEGTDRGKEYTLRITTDALEEHKTDYNTRLYNGKTYYFGVSAYNYTSDGNMEIRSFESDPTVVVVRPQIPFGLVSQTAYGDTLPVIHVAGKSDIAVYALVVDPTHNTGDTYEVRFDTTGGLIIASLWDTDKSRQVCTAMIDDPTQDVVMMGDGIRVVIEGGASGFTQFEVVANAGGPLIPSDQGCFAFSANGFPLLYNDRYPNGADGPTTGVQQTNGSNWGIHTGATTGNDGTFNYFTARVTQTGERWSVIDSYDYEIRFTGGGAVGFEPSAFTSGSTGGTRIAVPFELWNIGIGTPNDASDDFRLFPYLLDSNGDGMFNLSPIDHPVSGGDNDPETDWFYWVLPSDRSPGQAGYDAIASEVSTNPSGHEYLGLLTAGTEVMRRMVLVNWNGGSVSDPAFPANVNQPMPEQGTVFRITTAKPPTPDNVFRFSVPALLEGPDVLSSSVQRVGVYPNPYVTGWSYSDETPNQYVTFNNLPDRVIIRIFNLAGQAVRTLRKDNSSQFQIWDLRNESNQPVASGIYICYVEMPDLGQSKILKLAIVQQRVF